jgi:pimeloyl-ACP methyl ester carboxylesterase
MCLTGAIKRTDGSNQGFNLLCDGPEVPGVVQSCDANGCYNTFESFLVDVRTIYPSLFKALDKNHDGKYDEGDAACRVHLLGFSWGGVAAVQIAGLFLGDANVAAPLRTVARLVVLDPFQPGTTLTIPAGVAQLYELRHSVAPPSDCSRGSPLGPYLGLVPHCSSSSTCADYDYSLAPDKPFPSPLGSMLGGEVGHCDVPWVAGAIVREIFASKPLTDLPPSVPVGH